jgi:tripartite-type tricarboxylate transporter receptor subunit TctC
MRTAAYAIVASLVLVTSHAAAQPQPGWPAKPVRMLLGPGPGSVADGLTRVMAQALSEHWGQQVVVENRSGAGNTIAPAIVAKSPPDGYTLHRCGVGDSIAPALYKKLSYDHLKDFAILARIGHTPNILVVHPSLPVTGLQDFIKLARANPGKLDYGTTGIGSSPQLSFELLKSMTKINVVFVPYKMAALAQTDLLAGRIIAQMSNLPNHIDTVKQGKVRALGVTSGKRNSRLPQVPTIAEQGVPGYDVSSWYGICAPAGVEKSIQAKIEGDSLKVLAIADVKQRLMDLGVEVEPMNSVDFTAFFRSETERWGKVVREAGIPRQ